MDHIPQKMHGLESYRFDSGRVYRNVDQATEISGLNPPPIKGNESGYGNNEGSKLLRMVARLVKSYGSNLFLER